MVLLEVVGRQVNESTLSAMLEGKDNLKVGCGKGDREIM